ncbi:LOG family protein [candidate division CSSED10-310 bacterium]|uniref:LOG family protein n=1 Tax=candidate division CSSED10-310 bacterium TaxID=2855610 RepID=A0ABV6Z698_UNCC1
MVEFQRICEDQKDLSDSVIQGLDLRDMAAYLTSVSVRGAVFLGCIIPDTLSPHLQKGGATIFPRFENVPYSPYRATLYTPEELFAGFDASDPYSYCHTPDALVYEHWVKTGRSNPNNIVETLARRLHDHAITDAMREFIGAGALQRQAVSVMGGHSLLRSDNIYAEVSRIARALTRAGYLMTSGGGPGAMEATHLGAWFADRKDEELEQALNMLSKAPHYKDLHWLAAAYKVRQSFPPPGQNHISLGIPTWLYGHEPPNPFASHIAKYFANSVREDGLVTIARYGIIFAPGGAGTIQEIFQDATQNRYATMGEISPMIFLGTEFWTKTKPVYPLLSYLAQGKEYAALITILDEVEDVVSYIQHTPPKQVAGSDWSFCAAYGVKAQPEL